MQRLGLCWFGFLSDNKLPDPSPAPASRCLGHVLQYFRNLPLALPYPRFYSFIVFSWQSWCTVNMHISQGSEALHLRFCHVVIMNRNTDPKQIQGLHSVRSFQELQQTQQQPLETIFMTGITLVQCISHFRFLLLLIACFGPFFQYTNLLSTVINFTIAFL